ncbi:MAG TPA: DUF3090 family protein [Ktedonobacteraceae bacterium]|nr:DUF3090 family protein [Ktedonobacteraceae bacterium]
MSKELGTAELLGADAVGQPGQRRFCLFVRSRRGTALMWMEKDQLNRLSLTLDQVLAQLTSGQVLRTEAQAGSPPPPPGLPPNFPRTPEYDFRSAQMALTFNESDEMFSFTVAPVDILLESGQEPQALVHEEDAVSFSFTMSQAQELASTINVLMTGGRPVCPFCHTPLDGGPHACVKQNGHHEIIQVIQEEDDEEEE